jgi:cobyrinic acid a,c-diamide synthase
MAHLFISAAHKSSGKTTVSIGLCAALAAKGLAVQPFKKGPDYIDPLWLGRAAGRDCYNLDFYTMSREEIGETFAQQMLGADIGIIEGNKGLYDGLDLDGSNSNAALAAQLQAPVVLVLDTRGMTRGIAPLILGYQAFDPNIRIAGVILNQVGGSRHEGKLRQVIEHYTDVKVLGAVAKSADLEIVERHLGLMPSNEDEGSTRRITAMGEMIADQVDLDEVFELAWTAPAAPHAEPLPAAPAPDVRIGYARDEAFGFYYPCDLAALRQAGAELVPFDTLKDHELPEVDGLFIGGGFPETRMAELHANAAMRSAVRDFIESGGPAYAECGGLMYLSRTLTWGEKHSNMAGVIPADVVMHPRPQGRGYVRLAPTDAHPWPGDAAGPVTISAHEFHYSGLENLPDDMRFAYRMERGHGIDGQHDGIVYKNLLASYTHMRDTGGNHWARRFVEFVRHCRNEQAARS